MNVRVHACIGGKNYEHDLNALEAGVQVVVGTPGRVQDLIYRRKLRINKLEMFVLDEADEMLSRGFKTKIYEIFKDVPPKTQVSISNLRTAVSNRKVAETCVCLLMVEKYPFGVCNDRYTSF